MLAGKTIILYQSICMDFTIRIYLKLQSRYMIVYIFLRRYREAKVLLLQRLLKINERAWIWDSQ